ncbi:MAG: glycosyltransferase family 2 protein [Prevotellaceae bacterium]|jgi:glycosyltransferase involved in cell wall biosynthesis|nr:glycosyltransferase family 2 protein [Prevotellaceae bacterium]
MSEVLYIVMPAYNEAENIKDVVAQWRPIVEKVGGESRLVIFDDGSKDDTYERLKLLEQRYPRLVAETKANSGHGATCLYAYRYAVAHNADYIFQTDSDGQTNPDEFWKFWEQRAAYDLITGSRKAREDGFSRVVVTKTLKMVVLLIFGVSVEDANTPFRLMKKDFLSAMLRIVPENFFLSNVAIAAIAVKKKCKTLWMPITFKPRQKGVNSINLKRIFRIGLKALGDFREVNRRLKSR